MDWQRLFEQSDPANFLVGLVAAVGLGFTVMSIRRQTRNSRLEKVADVMMDCTRRFADLVALRYQLEASEAEKKITQRQAARRYYNAYWYLQWDQFNYYLLGLLPREVLAVWFMERLALLKRGEDAFGTSFAEGWTNIGRSQMMNYADFSDFVDEVWKLEHTDKEAAKKKIDELLRLHLKNNKAMRDSYR